MTWPEAVRELVQTRALGSCEYGLLDQADAGFPHEIDHIHSRKHGGSDTLDNLAYACFLCNRSKGADIASLHPDTGALVRLFHPRLDAWNEHFRITGGRLEPRREIGLITAQLLHLNTPARVLERELLQRLGRYRTV